MVLLPSSVDIYIEVLHHQHPFWRRDLDEKGVVEIAAFGDSESKKLTGQLLPAPALEGGDRLRKPLAGFAPSSSRTGLFQFVV
jgi:hypothetical protein